MRRKSTLLAWAAVIVIALAGVPWLGCGQSVDGQLSIELRAGCRPTLAEIEASVGLFCISLERSDGTSLVDPNCSNTLAGVRLEIAEPAEPVVVVVEGLERLGNGRHQVIARGKSPPVLLVSGDKASVEVPITPVGSFGLLAAGEGGCPALPLPMEGHTASVYPSGHAVLVGSARLDADSDAVGLLIDGVVFSAQRLPTPTSLHRHGHAAATLDDGRLVLAGGVLSPDGQATREVVVLRGAELMLEAYRPGLDYSLGLSFEPLVRTLVQARARAAAEVFYGKNVLITDGESTAEMFLGDNETSGELDVIGGQAFPANGLTITPVAYTDYQAILIGTPNRVGRLAPDDERSAAFYGYQASISGRDRPIGLLLPDGSIMAVGYRTGAAANDSPLVVITVGGDGEEPRVFDVPVPGGFPERGQTATLLLDGRVLVVGGVDIDGHAADSFFVVPGATASGWEVVPGPELNFLRRDHTASRLPDGRVLVVGGAPVGASAIDPALSAEVIAF